MVNIEKAPAYRRPRIRIVARSPEDGPAPYAIHVNGSRKPVAVGWDLDQMIYRQVERAYREYLRAWRAWTPRPASETQEE